MEPNELVRLRPADPPLPIDSALDQTGFAQHLEVARNGGHGDFTCLSQLTNVLLAHPDQVLEQSEPSRIG